MTGLNSSSRAAAGPRPNFSVRLNVPSRIAYCTTLSKKGVALKAKLGGNGGSRGDVTTTATTRPSPALRKNAALEAEKQKLIPMYFQQQKEIKRLRRKVRNLENEVQRKEEEVQRVKKQVTLLSYGITAKKKTNEGKTPKVIRSLDDQLTNTLQYPAILKKTPRKRGKRERRRKERWSPKLDENSQFPAIPDNIWWKDFDFNSQSQLVHSILVESQQQ